MRSRLHSALALVALATLPLQARADARTSHTVMGPPWISIESPANPFNKETKGALLVVRVYHHGEASFYPVTGTAEGLVAGQRQTIKLEFTGTSTPGMYALKFKKPAEGNWILVISAGSDPDKHGLVTALVSLGSDGAVASVQVPTRQEGQWLMPAAVSEADINVRLKEMSAA